MRDDKKMFRLLYLVETAGCLHIAGIVQRNSI